MGSANIYTVEVANRVDELERVYEGIELFATESGLPPAPRRSLLLVAEELFVNVVGYGYDEGAEGRITVTLGLSDGDAVMTLTDDGRFFDPSHRPPRPVEEPELTEMPIGGLGLFLVHEHAKSVTHRRDGERNVTEVRVAI